MGTSLSGLTPATTFDGLLKVGDNDPLTADLKAISDGSGNDSAIQLSTGELKVIGQFNLDSDTAATTINLRGDSLSINQIYQANNVTYNSIVLLNSSGIRLNNGTGTALLARGGNVGIGGITATPSARLQVKGSGTTSATTSLLVQNSAGGNVFSITDDGFFTFNDPGGSDALTIENGNNISQIRYNDSLWLGSSHGTYVPTLKIDRTAGLSVETTGGSLLNLLYDTGNLGIGETTPTARLHMVSADSLNTGFAIKAYNTNGNELISVRNDGTINMLSGKAIKFSGSEAFTGNIATGELKLAMHSAYDLTTIESSLKVLGNGNDATTTALLVQNSDGDDMLKVTDDSDVTLSKLVTIRNSSAGLFARAYADGYGAGGALMWINGSMNLGSSPSTAAKLSIKGSGNDATTTALLVQNSDGDDLMEVEDGGNVGIGQSSPLSATLHIKSQSYFYNTTAFRIQNSIGNNLFRVRGDGTTDILNSRYIFYKATEGTGGAVFKGSGTTSATTALLVQDSAGTDLLKVTDDGSVFSNGGGAKISSNTGFGEGVLASVTTANNTSAFGVGALQAVTTGVSNTGLGWRAGYSTTGSNNAFVGLMAGYTNSSGSNNTGLGTRVLYDNATGSDNTAVGFRADSDGFSGSVILGKDATATADNQFVVGSSGINAGTVANIGDPNPTHTWEVVINGTKYRILLQEVV